MLGDTIKEHIILVWSLNEETTCEADVYGRVILKYLFKIRRGVVNGLNWLILVSSGRLW